MRSNEVRGDWGRKLKRKLAWGDSARVRRLAGLVSAAGLRFRGPLGQI